MYLENIFASPDINWNLKEESSQFEQVDKFFKKQLKNMFSIHLVSKCIKEGS